MKRLLIVILAVALVLVPFVGTAHGAEQDWKIVKGFGTAKGTGAGLSEEEGSLVAAGFGELCYTKQPVTEAVAIQFRINAYPTKTHYFYFGLMDTADKMWDTTGKNAKGIVGRVTVATGGDTVTLTSLNTGTTGTSTIGTVTSQIRALGADHMLVMYKEGDLWYVLLDGVLGARVPATSTTLADACHLIAGSYSSSTMEMEIKSIFMNDEVTQEMKDGSYIKNVVGDDGQINTYYDEEGRLIVGDTVINSVGTFEAPSYGVREMLLVISGGDRPWVPYLVVGAGVSLVLAIIMFILEGVKSARKKKKGAQA